MTTNEILKEEYQALRKEIETIKSRLFFTICLGVVLVPVLTYLAESGGARFVGPIIPFVVMVLTIMYVSEEQALMRCGRYIRERIEPQLETSGGGWESWLESQPALRVMDKILFGCFLITFFVFYAVSSAIAIESLWTGDDSGLSAQYKAGAGALVYAIGLIWIMVTALHHWRSCTQTVG